MTRPEKLALVGAGPMGLAMARNLRRFGLPFDAFEIHLEVGGLWNIDNPHSTMYESAHLISSKRMTEFEEFPMRDEVADYPSHAEVLRYFLDYADEFDLRQEVSLRGPGRRHGARRSARKARELRTLAGELAGRRRSGLAGGVGRVPRCPPGDGDLLGAQSARACRPGRVRGRDPSLVGLPLARCLRRSAGAGDRRRQQRLRHRGRRGAPRALRWT